MVLIKQGLEALGPLAEPHEIGCTARVIEVEPLSEGRMNIVALGQERFRILTLDRGKEYLVGEVELYPLGEKDKTNLVETGNRLHPWVKRYMDILSQASESDLKSEYLPNDPVALAYLAAVLLQVPPKEKQALLAAQDADGFLEEMYDLYRREVVLLDAIVAREPEAGAFPFSRN